MRRLVLGFSLAATLILGGMVGACQPTKPCRCVQSGGCRCPLPPPLPQKTSAPTAHQQSRQMHTARGTRLAQHEHRGGARRQGHAISHAGAIGPHRGVGFGRHGGHVQRTHAPASRSGGALSYNYHGSSPSDHVDEHAPPHNRFAVGDGNDQRFIEGRFAYRGHRHPTQHDYGIVPYRREAREEVAYGTGVGPVRMSINSPEALEPWYGYDIKCPDGKGE